MTRKDDSSNPYAPPAAESTPSPSSRTEDPDVARLIKYLPWRRRVFATVLAFGGFYAISGAGAVAIGIAEGATITSPNLGVGIAALGFGLPLALLGALLALRVRLAQFIAFPLTAVCGGMGGVGFLVAVMRASAIWAKRDPAPTLAILALAIVFLACSLATGWFFHRTVMALARAGVPLDASAADRS
jgi:hypothetical protein